MEVLLEFSFLTYKSPVTNISAFSRDNALNMSMLCITLEAEMSFFSKTREGWPKHENSAVC